ncbi:MAG: hypothetical protein K9N09_08565 [Candidatus Cloacimonetes bacterium]|nr:hypothetical protein [Candidatus Cloacimonadota bacterium]MCF7868737.1 hypothetical protein [Candidatus Cloacimonadota bacterium]MCF7884113.1 hypothetical protein [Candidatus Cloacimonadota bacterium]
MKQTLLILVILTIASGLFAYEYEAGDHDLFLMPTAYTMPKGSKYFSDYELFFLNYAIAPTDRTHLALFTLFPITTDFLNTFSVGVKQNYLRKEKIQSAFWCAFNPESVGLSIGNVLSLGQKKRSIHVGLSALTARGADDFEFLYMLGARLGSERSDFIIEFENTNSLIDSDFSGIMTLGFRFRGKTITWDFAGIRPLFEDMGNLLFIPFLKATVYFE